MTREELIRAADAYARRVGSVGDPRMRPAQEAMAMAAFLAGIKAGIEFAKQTATETLAARAEYEVSCG